MSAPAGEERAPLPVALERPERGRALLVVPHPDDDVIGCGGSAALHAEQGDPVRVLVLYDGVEGDPERRWDPDELRELRHREARAGGRHLGLSDYLFWDYPEGHLPGPSELLMVAERIAELVREYRPTVVYAPWIGEHHVDHHVAARLVRGGLALAGFEGRAWGFEVWTPLVPTHIVDVTRVFERKMDALREHATQLAYADHVHAAMGMQAQRSLYLPDGARYGEALRPLGPPSAEDAAVLGLG